MKPSVLLSVCALALAACAAPPDPSRYVSLSARRGYYLVQAGSPLQDKLGYGLAPVSDPADPLHRGYGTDVIAFYFNRSRVLAAPPAYITEFTPDRTALVLAGALVQGKSTQAEVERLFPTANRRIPQPGGALLVYHKIDVYNALEQMTGSHGSH